jgi:hypothetical protein
MARRDRVRRMPTIDALEPRIAASTFPPNTLSTDTGQVVRPGQVDRTATLIARRNLAAKRHATLIGLTAQPDLGSPLRPRIVDFRNARGTALPLRAGTPFVPGRVGFTQAFAKVASPGMVTTGVTGQEGTTGTYVAQTRLLGDLNGDGQVTEADLQLFPSTYRTRIGEPNYNSNADANQNGYIGIGDARALVHNLSPTTPKRPLSLALALEPGDQAHYSAPHNSGGLTFKQVVTIVGRTTPGSIVLTDSGLGDYSFQGVAIATDAQGRFTHQVRNEAGINTYNFLVIDPFGQQTIRSFPVFWITFAAQG